MPGSSYSYTNPTSSGSSGSSFGQSNSQSVSFDNSQSSAKAGSAFSKEALARIAQLYPQLLGNYAEVAQRTPYSDLLQETGGQPMDFGKPDAFPNITTGPIWNENQIQGRVNTARAQNDLGLAGATHRLGEQVTARGFGSNSPLYQELAGNLQGQNMAANTQAENDLRWAAAQGNAQHLLSTQQADVGRAGAQEAAILARLQSTSQDELQRRQLGLGRLGAELGYGANRQNALLQALGYYNQPLPFSESSSKRSAGSRSESSSTHGSTSGSFGGGGGGESFSKFV